MNFSYFLAKRITLSGQRTFSKLIVRVTIGAIVLAVAAMILSVAILRGFKGEIVATQRGFFGDIVLSKQLLNDSYESDPISLSASKLKGYQSHPAVASVAPMATKAGIITVNQEVEGVLLKGIDSSYNQSYFQSALIAGDTLNYADPDQVNGQILISKIIANRLSLSVGDDFIMYFVQEPIRKRKFKIQGIYSTGSEEMDKLYVIGSLDLIRRLNGMGQQDVGAYELRLKDFSKLAPLTAELADTLPLGMVISNIKDLFPDIFQWLDLLDMNAKIIFVLMAIVAIINMISALLITILERTNMIGILKALGLSNQAVRKVFLFNALYLIGLGLLIGNSLGLGLCLFQQYTHFFQLDEASYYMSYVPIDLQATDLLYINIGVVIISLVALLFPSMLITKISPIKAISFK
ncbi:ABC transporter permease [Sphingobacteriaceae bacterium WQ 2009]|uniref:ABC transporter permease n=1 Tax=Rhinopithecimicrobium faecis TaxID=2820698 RepID=A0A8T4H807_9SPHI|nr:ABC transporter permease [Sphingobacteriaceae bacterium WQ 2009]